MEERLRKLTPGTRMSQWGVKKIWVKLKEGIQGLFILILQSPTVYIGNTAQYAGPTRLRMASYCLCSGFSAEDSKLVENLFLERIKVAAEPMGRVGGKIPQGNPAQLFLSHDSCKRPSCF